MDFHLFCSAVSYLSQVKPNDDNFIGAGEKRLLENVGDSIDHLQAIVQQLQFPFCLVRIEYAKVYNVHQIQVRVIIFICWEDAEEKTITQPE